MPKLDVIQKRPPITSNASIELNQSPCRKCFLLVILTPPLRATIPFSFIYYEKKFNNLSWDNIPAGENAPLGNSYIFSDWFPYKPRLIIRMPFILHRGTPQHDVELEGMADTPPDIRICDVVLKSAQLTWRLTRWAVPGDCRPSILLI